MNEIKEYKHSNGYYAKLYGESSMTIYRSNGRMFMHTGFRSVNTENEVMSILKRMPEQEKVMAELMK